MMFDFRADIYIMNYDVLNLRMITNNNRTQLEQFISSVEYRGCLLGRLT